MHQYLTQYASPTITQVHIHIEFAIPHQIVSSAVLNGGLVQANHIVNMKVPKTCSTVTPPEETLLEYSRNAGCQGKVVGMMMAASISWKSEI